SVCPSCSATYRADAWQLFAAGLRGGKGVPDSVGRHPILFVTLTAPGFGAVHSRRERGGTVHPCHPAGPKRRCGHGAPLGCWRRHEPDDDTLGQPLCAECFDAEAAVLWNACAPDLWRRTTIYMRRALARLAGMTVTECARAVRVSYTKVAEYQRRGLVHFHAVVRLDAKHDDPARWEPPPALFDAQLLAQAIRTAAALVTVPLPGARGSCRHRRVARWGPQIDIRRVADGPDGQLSAETVAAYIAKYATKDTEALGRLEPLEADEDLDRLQVTAHVARLARAAWELGSAPELADLRLRCSAHALGFRGHWSTKSRRYSTTLTALRRARMEWKIRRRLGGRDPVDPWGRHLSEQAAVVLGQWRYVGSGYRTIGDAWLAESAAADAREQRRAARLEFSTALMEQASV
ncbi:MAG: replication initiation protein, partial [Actinomycetota bacterium]|nr:replication initiation protein [Actinomycetota bacterium]